MNSREADALADHLTEFLAAGDSSGAFRTLKPVLDQRTPFRLLDRIATKVAQPSWLEVSELLDLVATDGSEGGWVIIGGMLRQECARQPTVAFAECRRYIVTADSWYGADILGERVPGPALVAEFENALALLAPWREGDNRWVRRSVGVAAHFWAKRSRGDEALVGQAESLLVFLAPMFGEGNMDAVKGVGWGLKTLGRWYPLLLADWLLAQAGRSHRRLTLRKAVTYLPDDRRRKVLEAYGL